MNMNAFLDACGLLPDALAGKARQYPEAEELRMRVGQPPTLLINGREKAFSDAAVTQEDLRRVLEIASGASLHAATPALRRGYLSYRGLRIGVCGEAAWEGKELLGFRSFRSLAVRIPHACSENCRACAAALLKSGVRNTLIAAPPGVGKTSLLRELICVCSESGLRVGVIDERDELSGAGFSLGPCSDVLRGLGKGDAAMMLLRGMNPQIIAMDEITCDEDLETVRGIVGCGVTLFATAHGRNLSDMRTRPLYRRLLQEGVFSELVSIARRKGERVYTREKP